MNPADERADAIALHLVTEFAGSLTRALGRVRPGSLGEIAKALRIMADDLDAVAGRGAQDH